MKDLLRIKESKVGMQCGNTLYCGGAPAEMFAVYEPKKPPVGWLEDPVVKKHLATSINEGKRQIRDEQYKINSCENPASWCAVCGRGIRPRLRGDGLATGGDQPVAATDPLAGPLQDGHDRNGHRH